MVRTTRKIGLGFMGLADLLILLATPYASEKAEVLAELIARFITYEARAKSKQMAEERGGAFPAFAESVFAAREEPPQFATPQLLLLRRQGRSAWWRMPRQAASHCSGG